MVCVKVQGVGRVGGGGGGGWAGVILGIKITGWADNVWSNWQLL